MIKNDALTVEKYGEIAVVTLDLPNNKINVLNRISLEGLATIAHDLEKDAKLKAVIIISGKENNFVAGADLNQLAKIKTAAEAQDLCFDMQKILNAIEQSDKIYICAIHGACIGGGFELALACHFRMATLDEKSIFSFPEVTLGFLPAAGGTQRLPSLIGIKHALDILLSGKKISARFAHKIGVIDEVVNQQEELQTSAIEYAKLIIKKPPRRRQRKLPWYYLPWLWVAKRKIIKKTYGLYPAPFVIIDAVKRGVLHGINAGLIFERQEFGKLVNSTISQNLLRLFFLQKERQKNPFGEVVKPAENIGVIGSGLMGSGIAYVSLSKGFRVFLNDTEQKALSRAEKFISQEFNREVKNARMASVEMKRLYSHLSVNTSFESVKRCDAVIEAVFEDLEVKHQLLQKLEALLKPDGIFATNTSSLPIGDIAKYSSIKDRIVGMHYFSPVPKVILLEVVKGKNTSTDTLKKACDIGLRQGKTIIVVNDHAGFYTTRIISALFDEVAILLNEGHPPYQIDHHLKQIGFPMGPVALMDEVGLDVGLHVSKILYDHYGDRLIAANLKLMEDMIASNYIGHKSGKGFYVYDDHRQKINSGFLRILSSYKEVSKNDAVPIAERMLLRMVNEAAFCFSENVIESTDDGDVGAVFGVGFPSLLGGPFRFIEQVGKKKIALKLDALQDSFGDRFRKAPFFS